MLAALPPLLGYLDLGELRSCRDKSLRRKVVYDCRGRSNLPVIRLYKKRLLAVRPLSGPIYRGFLR